jgi:hypothetical protein
MGLLFSSKWVTTDLNVNESPPGTSSMRRLMCSLSRRLSSGLKRKKSPREAWAAKDASREPRWPGWSLPIQSRTTRSGRGQGIGSDRPIRAVQTAGSGGPCEVAERMASKKPEGPVLLLGVGEVAPEPSG